MKLKSDKYKSGEKALTHKEYDTLIDSIADLEDELLIKLAVATGLRREDICNVLVSNIDLENNTLIFFESKKNITRPIFLSDSIVTLIRKYLKTIPQGGYKRKYKKQIVAGFLFSIQGRSAYRHFNYWCKIAGIDERPFHALRATCIKFAHDAHWSDEQISKLTGDKISTIQEHYMTPSNDEMRQAAKEKAFV
jgi:integrase